MLSCGLVLTLPLLLLLLLRAVLCRRVEADPNGSRDTCILVFSAGPPYEDIAFRIVNKEWETTHRRGFKCTYDRGILHLYFNFKRARYRR
jgi:hypothetical protein